MFKKGQLSVFFMVIVIIAVVVFLSNALTKEKANIEKPEQIDPTAEVRLFVEGCLNQVGEDGIYHTLLQGGYYYGPFNSVPFLNADIPLYWWNGRSALPSKKDIETELALYVDNNLRDCLNDFAFFREQGFEIDYDLDDTDSQVAQAYNDEFIDEGLYAEDFYDDELTEYPDEFYDDELFFGLDHITVTILDDGSIDYRLRYPITFTKRDTSFRVESFRSSVPIDLAGMYSLVREIIIDQSREPNSFPLGFITNTAYENQLTFEMLEYNDDTIVIGLIFPQENKPEVIYTFGLQYEWSGKTIEELQADIAREDSPSALLG